MDGPQQSFLSIVNRTECTCRCFEEGAQSAWEGLRRVHRVHGGLSEGAQIAWRVLRRVHRVHGEFAGEGALTA